MVVPVVGVIAGLTLLTGIFGAVLGPDSLAADFLIAGVILLDPDKDPSLLDPVPSEFTYALTDNTLTVDEVVMLTDVNVVRSPGCVTPLS